MPDYANPPAGPPDPPPNDPRHDRTVIRWVLTVVIVVFGLAGVGLSAEADRLDSGLLFVGVPCLMAFAFAMIPTEGGWPSLMQAITIVLLLFSALLHEGAICVLLAAPLVYGTAAVVYSLSRDRPRHYAFAPFLVLLALEGAVPGARVNPDQDATATAVVADDCAEFRTALERGPRIDPEQDRGRLLDVAGYPTPSEATGTGLEQGDTWRLAMPVGSIDTEVVATAADRIEFTVVEDSAPTTRWVELTGGTLSWDETEDGCEATMAIEYRRKLDPSWWFGPVTELFMNAGADAFLSGLD